MTIGVVDDEEDDYALLVAAAGGGGKAFVGEATGGHGPNKRLKTASSGAGLGGRGGGGGEGSYTAALRGSRSSLWQEQHQIQRSNDGGRRGIPAFGVGMNVANRNGHNDGNSNYIGNSSSFGPSGGSCFKCGQPGHWARDFAATGEAEGQQQRPRGGAGSGDGTVVAEKPCPCGLGDCLVLTSNTTRNPGRKFYRCPVKEENGGCNFFEWCENPSSGISASGCAPNYPSNSSVPALPCPCGAGSCLVLTAKTGKNVGQPYYRCPTEQGTGSCVFFKWCNQYNSVANQPASEPSFASCHSSGGKSASCFKCGQEGHWARDCPNSLSDPHTDMGGSRSASSGTCFKCGKAGHWARDCPAQDTSFGAGRRRASDTFCSSYTRKSK